jgi:glycosyltransferase involved in cell wall biosynthesis
MDKNRKEKIVAIIPARNEEKTIGGILKVLLDSKRFDEIIVVDGASTDNTAKISESIGAKVIRSPKREGKGMAMKKGLESADAEIVVFFDADLIGLTKEHIPQLVDPVLRKEVVMCTGERGRCLGLPYIIASVDPLLAIGGERAIRRYILEDIPEKFIQNFAVETALNYYCRVNDLPTALVKLKGVQLIPKEKKWGLVKGLTDRAKEIWQIIKVRFLIIISKKDFKIKNV